MSTLPPLTLESIDIKDLELAANAADVRYDLHAFADYIRSHEIKRGFRNNRIPTAHQQKLRKLMSDPASAARPEQWRDAAWIEHLDGLALALKWVRYDTGGQYMGYTSSEPSFPDNFMKFEEGTYERFVQMSLQEQEDRLVTAHVERGEEGASEFFSHRTLSRLDSFDGWGCATGVVPTIAFSNVRRHLLQLLARCPVGVWFSTASLVDYLRKHEPWFLIPKEIPSAARNTGFREGRYANFIERKRGDWSRRDPLSDNDREGFAKVEGRYLERFLEGAPLELGYVEVAYVKRKTETPIEPSRGLLAAFRVTERLRQFINQEIREPKVTVLPNFEVHVESLFFPALILRRLELLGEVVQRGIVTVIKLTKPKVAAALAADPNAQVAEKLRGLSGRDLPANVEQELGAWAGHSEKFILYEGYGLLEGEREAAVGAERFVVEAIAPDYALVRSPEKLYRHLEAAEQVPSRIEHAEGSLVAPRGIHSRLAPSAQPPRAARKPLKLKRSMQTTLWFADAEAHAAFAQLLLHAKCVVPVDERALTVSYPRKAEPVIKECLKKLNQEYSVATEDMET